MKEVEVPVILGTGITAQNAGTGLRREGFVFSVPIGFEYAVDEHLTLRGGAEEGYARNDNSIHTDTEVVQVGSSSWHSLNGSLWSVVSAGATFNAKDVGEINTYISYDFMQIAGYSLSLVYFP